MAHVEFRFFTTLLVDVPVLDHLIVAGSELVYLASCTAGPQPERTSKIAEVAAPDLQPTLEGPTLQLRPAQPDDWQEMYSAASDPEIWAGHPERNRWEEPIFRLYFDSAVESRSALAILDRATGKIIGSSRYFGFDPHLSEIEIGWTFRVRRYWGGASNQELKRLMLDHAFNFVDWAIFWVGESNFGSRRAMEKVGGVLRDEVRIRTYSAGPVRHVVYEVRNPRRFTPKVCSLAAITLEIRAA